MGANFFSRMNQLEEGRTDLAIGILILLPRRFFLGLVVTGCVFRLPAVVGAGAGATAPL